MWDWNYVFEVFPQIFESLKITILATAAGFLVAMILGLLLAVILRSNNKLTAKLTRTFVELIRSTPILVQLYIIFYVLPKFGIVLSPFISGVIGLGVHYSTYLSEVYRSGIDSVSKGQWEAGYALGFSKLQIWMKIVIPQAIPPIIPVMGNYFITMFKETPILSAITLVEIMQVAKIIGARSFRYLECFTIVGILFFLISYPASIAVQHLTKKIRKKYSLD
jgi:polar amino acid transport system permease protein